MWYELLPKILNMSLTGSLVILAVLAARLLLRRVPKVFSYALWAVVLFRLLCPVSLPSDFSVFNLSNSTTQSSPVEYFQYNGKTEKPMLEFGTGYSAPATSTEQDTAAVYPEDSVRHTPDVYLPVALTIWLCGIAVMLGYSVISYFRLRRRLVGAVCLRDNIYLADGISSPFVMGLIRPKIYLPSTLSEKEQEYIILHEQHHIRRCDHVVKILSFAALCVHWFNPLVWLAFVLSGKDMEMSCDEAVIKKLGGDIRVDYSASLLSLATGRRIISGTPLAFGEGDTGGRIRNVLNYKKPAFWVVIAAVVACIAVALCLVTNPKQSSPAEHSLPEEQSLSAEQALSQLENSVAWEEATVSFSIPKDYLNTEDWRLQISGRAEYDDGFSRSLHYLEGEKWQAGKTYTIQIDDAATALALYVTLPDASGKLLERNIDLLPNTKTAQKALSLNDVILLSQKGKDLTWADFDGHSYVETGSGLYIRIYEIDELYSLRIGGSSPSESPMYVTLYTNTEPESSIDIRAESVTDFISRHKEDMLDAAISNAILSQTGSGKQDGLIHVESHVVFDTITTPDEPSKSDSDFTVTVYALVLELTYNSSGGELTEVGGSYIPTALTFRGDTAGNYTLTEYWIPRDGSFYPSDITEKFPAEAAKQAMDTQAYIDRQKKECLERAQAYLDSNGSIDETIASLLETICYSPAVSSNPGDYITAHQTDFDTLVGYGEQTLHYCFGEFLQGGQTDLRGHIMMTACETILPALGEKEKPLENVVLTGQDWFDGFRAYAEVLKQNNSAGDLEKYYPATWLLLQMTQE